MDHYRIRQAFFNFFMRREKCNTYVAFTAVHFGSLTISLSYEAEYFSEKLIEATAIIWSLVSGPLAGIFIMGFFFPWVNSVVCTAFGSFLYPEILYRVLCVGSS